MSISMLNNSIASIARYPIGLRHDTRERMWGIELNKDKPESVWLPKVCNISNTCMTSCELWHIAITICDSFHNAESTFAILLLLSQMLFLNASTHLLDVSVGPSVGPLVGNHVFIREFQSNSSTF